MIDLFTPGSRHFNKLLCAMAILFLAYLGIIVFGSNGYLHLRGMRAELEQLKIQNASIEEENRALLQTVNRLKNDPVYIEHVIRKQLQMNEPNEIVFKFNKDPEQQAKESVPAPVSSSF
jgi:cell division protein FtsB